MTSGIIDVSSPGGRGGSVQVTGERVIVEDGARISATGHAGGGLPGRGPDLGIRPDRRDPSGLCAAAFA